MDVSPATYWSYSAEVLAFTTLDATRELSVPHITQMGESVCLLPPFFSRMEQPAHASCLGESCDTVLCSCISLFLHSMPQVVNQKDEGKCGLRMQRT